MDSQILEHQRGETDDRDFDGLLNIFEYLAGTGGLDAASFSGPVSRIVSVDANLYQALEYRRNTNAAAITWVGQFSSDPYFGVLNATVPISEESLGAHLEKNRCPVGNAHFIGS